MIPDLIRGQIKSQAIIFPPHPPTSFSKPLLLTPASHKSHCEWSLIRLLAFYFHFSRGKKQNMEIMERSPSEFPVLRLQKRCNLCNALKKTMLNNVTPDVVEHFVRRYLRRYQLMCISIESFSITCTRDWRLNKNRFLMNAIKVINVVKSDRIKVFPLNRIWLDRKIDSNVIAVCSSVDNEIAVTVDTFLSTRLDW